MLSELKKLRYECEMLTYPEGGHYVLNDAMKNIFDFFDKHEKQCIPKVWEKLEHKRSEKLPTGEEKLIRGVIKKYAQGYNKKDIKQVMACFSKEYSTDGITYPDARDKTNKFFSNSDSIEMKLKDVKIMLNADDVSVIAIAWYNLRWNDNEAVNGKLWFKFIKEYKDWKVVGGNLCEP
jgi:hypothetical protein